MIEYSILSNHILTSTIVILFNLHQPPLLTRARVNMFYDNIEYSTLKAEQVLGFRSKYTLKEGIKKTIAWHKEQERLK